MGTRSKLQAARRENLRRDLNALSGTTDDVEVEGKQYNFKKLKRFRCQKVLYNSVLPLLKVVISTLSLKDVTLEDLMAGKVKMNFDLAKVTLGQVLSILELVSIEKFWDVAKEILNGVSIDGTRYGALDDHEYYDDKQVELFKAVMTGLKVNYPHIAALLLEASGGGDSGQAEDETNL